MDWLRFSLIIFNFPYVLSFHFMRYRRSIFLQTTLIFRVKTFSTVYILKELIKYFLFIYFHFNERLCLFWVQLVLLNSLNYIMNTSSSFLRLIVEFISLYNFMQTSHNSSLNQTNTPINVMIFNSRNQNLFGVLN